MKKKVKRKVLASDLKSYWKVTTRPCELKKLNELELWDKITYKLNLKKLLNRNLNEKRTEHNIFIQTCKNKFL
jgi:hypothetical protein